MLTDGFTAEGVPPGVRWPVWIWVGIALGIILFGLLLGYIIYKLWWKKERLPFEPPLVEEKKTSAVEPEKRRLIPLVVPLSLLVWELVRHIRIRGTEKEPPLIEEEEPPVAEEIIPEEDDGKFPPGCYRNRPGSAKDE